MSSLVSRSHWTYDVTCLTDTIEVVYIKVEARLGSNGAAIRGSLIVVVCAMLDAVKYRSYLET